MELKVLKTDGTETGRSVKLNANVFSIDPNDHAIYLDVKSIMSHSHLGLHKVKNRSEVRGGGRKPWKQKGRGTARAGSTRSGVWVGGGSIFGPTPHRYDLEVNKKTKRLARISALSHKAKSNEVYVVEDFNFEAPKTKEMTVLIGNLNLQDKKTLVITTEPQRNVYLSGRNLQTVSVKPVNEFSTYDLLNCDVVLFQEKAIEETQKRLG